MNWLRYEKVRNDLLVELSEENWYLSDDLKDDNNSNNNAKFKKISPADLNKLRDIVSREFQREEEIYLKLRQNRNDSDEKWIRDVVNAGKQLHTNPHQIHILTKHIFTIYRYFI